MRDEEKRFTHESYGLAGLYRTEGTVGALFGSHLDRHHTTMHHKAGIEHLQGLPAGGVATPALPEKASEP